MADTIRMLISTDNHVGYAERDPIRGDDSWKSFHEVMCLAKEHDVDMVLLGGDLFHENKPSRKSMYNVMRSLRLNCYGDKPCELELLSDGSEHFDSTIGHANYEDPDINVAIPVFSIHGNHDDPSGEGFYAALDILEMAGLINYFGRVPESDNITVKPLFFQKGRTKLALYGLSNVRDERLHRTFRDGNAKFMRPGTQQSDWFNLLCVHQNHHAHTATSYLPEEQLPEYMDLVIWGHEHECDPIAHKNPERGFRVLQPGSSIATSLIPGEAASKQVFILTITGREFKLEPIRLKSVRPFVYKDIVLSNEKEALKIAKKSEHRGELTRFLEGTVRKLIKQAKEEWLESQGPEYDSNDPEAEHMPLPLVRLRVETTSPDGGVTKFDVENPQRFSNRFINEVANRNDVVQFFARKKASATRTVVQDTQLDAEILAKFGDDEINAIKVQSIVKEFLAAQSLSILPQNRFGKAVSDYIDKDDKHAMEHFVNVSLANQIKNLARLHRKENDGDVDFNEDGVADDIMAHIEQFRGTLEDQFKKGKLDDQLSGPRRFKPKPDDWDSDTNGEWEAHPGALIRPDEDDDEDSDGMTNVRTTATTKAARGRGRGRGRVTATTSARGRGRGTTKAAATTRTSKRQVSEPDSDEDEDVVMVDDDDDGDSQAMFVSEKKTNGARGIRAGSAASSVAASTTSSRRAVAPARKPPARAAASRTKQSTLSFGASQASVLGNGRGKGTGDDIEDDDDDDDEAFEPVSVTRSRRK